MSYLPDPDYNDESPIIWNICPHCNAVDVDWSKHLCSTYKLIEDDVAIGESRTYKCPYCLSTVSEDQFKHLWSDDFADTIVDYLPNDWEVFGTNDDWHVVELGKVDKDNQVTDEIICNVRVTEKGQIDFEYVRQFVEYYEETLRLKGKE